MPTCTEVGCRLRQPCPQHPPKRTHEQRLRIKLRRDWKDRIRYAQRHPITVEEVRALRDNPAIFDALRGP